MPCLGLRHNPLLSSTMLYNALLSSTLLYNAFETKASCLCTTTPFGLIFGVSCMGLQGETDLGGQMTTKLYIFSIFAICSLFLLEHVKKSSHKKTPVANVAMSFEHICKHHTCEVFMVFTMIHESLERITVNFWNLGDSCVSAISGAV